MVKIAKISQEKAPKEDFLYFCVAAIGLDSVC